MIVVLDASAAVKLVLDEQDSWIARRVWDEPVSLVAPTIVLPEVSSAIDAARRDGRLAPEDALAAQRLWGELTDEIDLVTVDPELARRAGAIAAQREIRGMDAVYLAVARMFSDVTEVGVLTFDVVQRRAVDDYVALLP